MKTFAVDPMTIKPVLLIRTGDAIERVEFKAKAKADKKIMELIRAGYRFDATHATMKIEA